MKAVGEEIVRIYQELAARETDLIDIPAAHPQRQPRLGARRHQRRR